MPQALAKAAFGVAAAATGLRRAVSRANGTRFGRPRNVGDAEALAGYSHLVRAIPRGQKNLGGLAVSWCGHILGLLISGPAEGGGQYGTSRPRNRIAQA